MEQSAHAPRVQGVHQAQGHGKVVRLVPRGRDLVFQDPIRGDDHRDHDDAHTYGGVALDGSEPSLNPLWGLGRRPARNADQADILQIHASIQPLIGCDVERTLLKVPAPYNPVA